MKLDGRMKGGLAWAGLVLILAVPSANAFLGQGGEDRATTLTSDTRNVKPVVPAAPATDPVRTATAGDPVDRYLSTGKPLPSYLSEGSSTAAAPAPIVLDTPKAPVLVSPPAAKPAPTQVAAVPAQPQIVAPIPMPRSMRPATPVASPATPVALAPAPAALAPPPASLAPPPSIGTAKGDAPLIIDETELARREATLGPVPPAAIGGNDATVVTGDQLQEWNSGSLADYLARKGLLSGEDVATEPSAAYDEDGFYLDEGPNSNGWRPARRSDRGGFWMF